MISPPGFSLRVAFVRNSSGIAQMMQHVGQADDVDAVIGDPVIAVDLMAIEHMIQIVQSQDIRGHDLTDKRA